MPKKKPPIEIDDEFDESPYEEALDALLENPRVQGLLGKFQNLLDRAGEVVDKAARGEIEFKRKPAETPKPKVSARSVLHFGPNEVLTEEKIKKRKKELARMVHPDAGGAAEEMARINLAAELLLKSLKK